MQTAIQHFNIHYPVAQDNDFATWKAFKNQYWPAEYLIGRDGNIIYKHFGEGNYDHTENAIREALGLSGAVTKDNVAKKGSIRSPEMYFNLVRLKNLTPEQSASTQSKKYTLPQHIALNNFALAGEWQFGNDHAELIKGTGKIQLHFSSGKLFMVASSDKPVTLQIMVDGKPQPAITVNTSQLYTLFDSDEYRDHNVDIEIPSAGFQAFTFTFG